MPDQTMPNVYIPKFQNPLELAQQAGTLQNTLNQNQLFKSKVAAGQAFQHSIGPSGTPNQNALLQGLASRPDAAASAQESAQQGQNLASTNLGFSATQQAGLASILGSQVMQGPDQQNSDAYSQRIIAAGKAGLLDPSHVQAALSRLPPAGSPPQAFQQFGLSMLTGALAGPQVSQMAFGTPIVNNNGQFLQGGTQASAAAGGGINLNGPQVPVGYPSRSELGAQQPGIAYDNQGNPIPTAVPMVTRLNLQGAGGLAGPAGQAAAAGQTLGTGRLPPPPGAAPSGPGQSAALPPGAVQTGMSVGTPDAIAADVGKFKTDQFAAQAGQTAVQSLQKAQHALELSNTGRSTEGVHNMYAFLQAQGVSTPGLTDSVMNYDLAHKYLLDYARQQGAAGKTDLQLQTAEGANASTGISQGAALNVIQTNIGRERQKIAQVMEAPNPTGIGYGSHASSFSNNTDPRGFAIDSYTPKQVSDMVSKMTPAEKTKFYKSVGVAQRLKLLNVPPPQAPAAAMAPAQQVAPTTTINPGSGGA